MYSESKDRRKIGGVAGYRDREGRGGRQEG